MTSNRLTAFWDSLRSTSKGAGVRQGDDTLKHIFWRKMPTSAIYGFPPRFHPLKKQHSLFLMPLLPQLLCGPVR